MTDEELSRRLDLIEQRLTAIERAAPGHSPTAVETDDAPATAVAATEEAWTGGVDDRGYPTDMPLPPVPSPVPVSSGPPPLPTRAMPMATAVPADDDRHAEHTRQAYDGGPPSPPPGTTPAYDAVARSPLPTTHYAARPLVDLEHLVGLTWTGWIGAIVLVIGAALGIKFGYDQGWFGGLPAGVRCGLIASAGVALLVAGEVVYRRVHRQAAVGLFGAGVVVLYLAVYAGQAWYGIIGPVAAAVMLTAVAAYGMLVAARADLVSVAVIAVLGAILCPTFTGALEHRPSGFRVYLLAVAAMSVGLCAWRATPKWWTLRGLTLAAIAFDLAVGTPGEYVDGFVLNGIIFALVAGLLLQGELVFTTWRLPRGLHGEPVPGVIFSLLTTFVVTVTVLADLSMQPSWVRGAMLLWLAMAAMTTGLFIARRSIALTILGRGFYSQAVLLLALSIPVTLEGPARLFGWMGLAVGLAGMAWGTRDRLAAAGATLIWVIAVVGAAVWALAGQDGGPGGRAVWLDVAGERVAAITVIAIALAFVGHGVALVLYRLFAVRPAVQGNVIEPTPGVLLDIATAAVFAAALLGFQSTAGATAAGLAYGLSLWLLSWTTLLAHLRPVAMLVLVGTAAKWAVIDEIRPRALANGPLPQRAMVNAPTILGALLAVVFVVVARLDRRRGYPGLGGLMALAIALVVGSAEISDYAVAQTAGPVWIVGQVGWSIYWGLLAVVSLVLGFLLHAKPLRLAALVLLGVTLLKLVVIDLAGAGTGWRILSFIGLGGLLLLTSVLYGRFKTPAVPE